MATADVVINNVEYYDVPSVVLNTVSGGTAEFSLGGSGGASQIIYCGENAPSSSLGENGDVYIMTESGGSAEVYPEDFTSQNMNSTSNLSACIGKSAEEGTSTSNVYSSGQSTTGIVNYTFAIDIPSSAVISSVSCSVKAHEENASRSTCKLQLYSGSTAKGSATTVNGTSNAIYNLNTGTWSRAEIDNLTLRMSVGYYGGLIAGATLIIAYTMEQSGYEVTLTGSTSSWSIKGDNIYQKNNGSWSQVSSVTLDSCIQKS